MPFEKSAGFIIYQQKEGKNFFLLLHYPNNRRQAKGKDFWEFPKGHIEKGESDLQTALREIKEETGMEDLKVNDNFKEWIKYYFRAEGNNIFKVVVFFLGQTKTTQVKISDEHIGYEWLEFDQAYKRVAFPNSKKILKKANDFLKN
jgi:8-oxo-dGTP pyrophosphatase MutT (NUDIX family)